MLQSQLTYRYHPHIQIWNTPVSKLTRSSSHCRLFCTGVCKPTAALRSPPSIYTHHEHAHTHTLEFTTCKSAASIHAALKAACTLRANSSFSTGSSPRLSPGQRRETLLSIAFRETRVLLKRNLDAASPLYRLL